MRAAPQKEEPEFDRCFPNRCFCDGSLLAAKSPLGDSEGRIRRSGVCTPCLVGAVWQLWGELFLVPSPREHPPRPLPFARLPQLTVPLRSWPKSADLVQ